MNFALTFEQELLQQEVTKLLAVHCTHDRLQAQINGEADHDPTLWAAACDMGLPGLLTPEEHGGVGLTMVEAALVAEAMGYAGAPIPLFGHWLATLAIRLSSDEPAKAELLPLLATGEWRATVAVGAGEGRWRPQEWTCQIDNGALTGCASFVPNAANADIFVVGLAGGELALVRSGEGVRARSLEAIDRTRPMHEVTFEAAPATVLAGQSIGHRLFDAALVLLAADGFGGASHALDMTLEYIKQREQFGSVIGRFQAVKHQVANVALEIEPSRALYWYAAFAYDNRPEDSSRMAALAKAHISDIALQAGRDCLELHGGVGYTWEYDFHIWLKRAMANYAWAGGADVHRLAYCDANDW